jgi:hypothetical protein
MYTYMYNLFIQTGTTLLGQQPLSYLDLTNKWNYNHASQITSQSSLHHINYSDIMHQTVPVT